MNETIKSEVLDLYDGTYASLREIAKLFNDAGIKMDVNELTYFVDHNDTRRKHIIATRKWMANHPEKTREMQKKAAKKYSLKPGVKKKRLQYYQENKELYRVAARKYYHKRKEEGCYRTDEFRAKRRKYYLKRKKEGFFKTNEFKEKCHKAYLKRKIKKMNLGSK